MGIRSVTPSKSKPTINDVAARAGVSKKTVSRVINGEGGLRDAMRARVESAISELGYAPNPQARALAFGRNFTLVLLHDNPNAQTVLNFQKGVLDAIGGSDLALMVRPVARNSPDLMEQIHSFLSRHRPLAALLLPPLSERDDLAQLCRALDVRCIRVGSALLDDAEHCVASNDCEAVQAVVAYLIAQGHRRIGFVRGPNGFRSAAERERGFVQAMAERGLAVRSSLCVEGDYRFDSGVDAGRRLLDQREPPTAVFASNDEMAAGVMHAALERGLRLPEQLSIAGFDDSPTARHVWPALTTVRWPIVEMGALAAQKAVAGILDLRPFSAATVTLPSEVVTRDSVARLKAD
jgi:LacI family transcriptional regulator